MAKTSITEEQELRLFVQEEFEKARCKNPAYSLRAYSRKLKIPVSALSGILAGKQRIAKKTGEKIVQALALAPERQDRILSALKYRSDSPKSGKKSSFLSDGSLIDMDQFHLISDWYYFGILSLAITDGFQGEAPWVAERLGINKQMAKTALLRLERLGLLVRESKGAGRFLPTGKQFKTTHAVPNTFVRKHHLQNLELSKRSMEEDAFEECDFSSMTMAVDKTRLPKAKEMIREFRRKLNDYLEAGEKKEVYRMCVQLFPLSGRKKK